MGARLGIFGALMGAAAAGALGAGGMGAPAFAVTFAAGLLVWTNLEYLMHRLAFHGFAPHSQHHAAPADPAYILAPLWLSLPAAAALFALVSLAASWARGAAFACGVMAGYLAYEAVHLRIHSDAAGGTLLRALRRHHFYHHFASDRVCFGVTSPVWDAVFGSLPERRRKPA